jgi:hypothetical protein
LIVPELLDTGVPVAAVPPAPVALVVFELEPQAAMPTDAASAPATASLRGFNNTASPWLGFRSSVRTAGAAGVNQL